jgi:GNAT superfamily N-acetyltransferase
MPSLEVVPLREAHLADAAALVRRRYRALRNTVPALPPRYAELETWLPRLRELADAGPGVAALHAGRLVGFIGAWRMDSFRGKRTVFSPEWGNAALLADSRRIYEALYAQLSAAWIAAGYFTQLVSVLANDRAGWEGWSWLGFGMLATDAVRYLHPVRRGETEVQIRRATLQELPHVMALNEALAQHLAAAPTFLVDTEVRDRAYYAEWLQDPGQALWLAYQGGEAVAYLGLGPASDNASTIIRDAKTTSVTGAFTREAVRGTGVATALLDRGLAWARAAGYARCAVDFEPMNPSATRFWLRHFTPVCHALIRHVDERAQGSPHV